MISTEVKNGISCNCDRNILRLTNRLFRAFVEKRYIPQELAEEIAPILGVERCVIFKIYGAKSGQEAQCRMVAGVPIGGHFDMKERNPLKKHPDIEMAYNAGIVKLIDDPLKNEYTDYIKKDIIAAKGINQILYVPLVKKVRINIVTAVIVMDALGEKTFSDENIAFCECIREVISNILNIYDIFQQDWEDRLRNPASVIGGFSKRIEKIANKIEETSEEIAVVVEDSKFVKEKIESIKSLAKEIAATSKKVDDQLKEDKEGGF